MTDPAGGPNTDRDPPDEVEYRSTHDAHCGRCGRQLQHVLQYRCPYVSCREWLMSASEIDADHERQRASTRKDRKERA